MGRKVWAFNRFLCGLRSALFADDLLGSVNGFHGVAGEPRALGWLARDHAALLAINLGLVGLKRTGLRSWGCATDPDATSSEQANQKREEDSNWTADVHRLALLPSKRRSGSQAKKKIWLNQQHRFVQRF